MRVHSGIDAAAAGLASGKSTGGELRLAALRSAPDLRAGFHISAKHRDQLFADRCMLVAEDL